MSGVVMDEAYFERRAAERQWEATMSYMRVMSDSFRAVHDPDTPKKLREEYATGRIDLDELQRRLDLCI